MKIARLLLILAAGLAAAPVAAQPPRTATAIQALEADQAAYVRWLARLSEIERPVHDALGDMQGRTQALMASPDLARAAGELRPVMLRHVATVDAVDARLAALDVPDIAALNLPEELRPAAIRRQMLELNRNVRAVLRSFIPLLDAVARGDFAAAAAAGDRAMESVRLMLESQLLLGRASQAAIPRTFSAWEMANVQLIYLRLTVRLAGAFPRAGGRLPPMAPISRDMVALADELDATAREGDAKVLAELRMHNALLADAERRGDAAVVAIARRGIVFVTEGRAYLALARDFALLLRREAAAMLNRPMTPERYVETFQRFYPIRNRLGEIDRNLAARLGRL